jgi:hypothetical protein
VPWINAKKSIAPADSVIVIYAQRQLVEKDMAIRAQTKNVLRDIRAVVGATEWFDVTDLCPANWLDDGETMRDEEPGKPLGPGRNSERDFHGQRRRNETHASATDTASAYAPDDGERQKVGGSSGVSSMLAAR